MQILRYKDRAVRVPLVLVAALCWTALILGSLLWNLQYLRNSAGDFAAAEARGALNKDLVYRRWATLHGGVYVPVSESTPPNPYLSDLPRRDVTTTDGQSLTLVNPAYMTRQVHEMGREQYGIRAHITSNNPLRPENAPDAWEAEALRAFEGGAKEVVSAAVLGGEPHVRVMIPMITEEGCLKCHAVQGYEVGQVRGGISVSVPLAPYDAVSAQQRRRLVVAHVLLWAVGLLGLWAAHARVRGQRLALEKQNEALLCAQRRLDASQARYFNLYDRAPVGYCTVTREGTILEANSTLAGLLQVPTDQLPGQAIRHYIQAEDRESFEELWGHLEIAEQSDGIDVRVVREGGADFWGHIYLSLAHDEDGVPLCRIGLTDVSERKHAQEVLWSEQQRLRYIIEAVQLGTWEWNVQTNEMVFNDIWANQLGYTWKELARYDLATRAQLTHPEDLERAEGILTRCLNGAVPAYECELRMQHKAGHWVWILDRGRVMTYDPTGAPLLMFGTHQDITSRKTAERTLIEREEELEVAQRIAQLGSWRLDLETSQVKWSMELYTMYGMDPALPPPPYTGHDRLFTPESWATLSAALEHTRLTGIPYELELDTVRADGGRGCMWVRGEVVRDAGGQVVGLQGVTQDISKRKAAEKALRDSEETHRALVASLPDIVKRFDREGRHLYVSDKVREITDIEASRFLGKTHRELGFPEAQCRFWETAIQQVFERGLPYEAEFTIEGKQGPMVHYFRLVPEQDADGAVHSVLALRRDITQQRRVEQDYKTLFREMLEGFAVHEIICDDAGRPVDYRFLAVNPGFERLTGLRSEEMLGKTVLEVMPDTEPFWIETYGQVALTGEPAYIEHRSNALGKFFEVRAFRPGPNQFACIFEDVSERKRLEDQLRQAQKMEAVGRLAGGVAHDFNNILQIILVNTELLQEEHEIGTQARRYTDEVKAAAEHAADLTRQLLTFSRRQVTQPVPLDLNTLLQSITKMIRRLIGEHIVLSADINPGLDVVLADKGQVEQVLINLCVNARDAMPEGGTIKIEAMNTWIDAGFCRHHPGAEEGRYVLLSVSDTGHGMDQETCAHIFEPFYTTKGVGEGTGLGLATVYGVVKQNKGFIHVYSEPGIGTVFRVYLPAVEQTKGLPLPVETMTVTTGTETILVAEDDPIVLDLVVRMLRSAGYTVLSATDGIEAVRVFEEHAGAIQLVILDVIMPGMGGRQVMDRILERHAGMRVLFSSGYSETGIHKDFVLHDGIQLIQKPYSKGDLLRAVRQALNSTP